MARQLRPEGLDFVETAPVRLVFAREMSASPEAVHRALAEDVPGWAEWFPGVKRARLLGDGTRREVWLTGGGHFEETILASKEPDVYAYRVDAGNAPGLRALVEEWRLLPSGTGTRAQWTFAADGSAPLRLVTKGSRAALGRAFRGAVTSLDRRLSA
ncbi:SRPBCC family protein [Streptomyces sp. NPDC002499]